MVAGNCPELDDILELRDSTNNAYAQFCLHILPGAVSAGKKKWVEKTAIHKISALCNPVEEAFALLELENNWAVWKEMAEWKLANMDKRIEDMPQHYEEPRWTVPRRRGELAPVELLEGWRKEGHDEYMRLFAMVKEDRNSEIGKSWESEFLKERKGRDEDNRGQKRDAVVARLTDYDIADMLDYNAYEQV